jgi:MscS family membrane protein
VSVRSDTSSDQLRYLLAEGRRMLYEHPKVESSSARIRLAGFDNNGLLLEIFSYVLTQDFTEFTAIREDLLLRIVEIVSKSGTAFAVTNSASQAGLDKEKAAAAERQVQQWREEHQFPFPDFATADKAAFRGAIAYPDPESAVGEGPR